MEKWNSGIMGIQMVEELNVGMMGHYFLPMAP
jgi:hypothetical protein